MSNAVICNYISDFNSWMLIIIDAGTNLYATNQKDDRTKIHTEYFNFGGDNERNSPT